MSSSARFSSEHHLGARIGSYRLTRVLGRGGMGVVYEAVHETIGKRAAVKVLACGTAGDPDYLRRFENEARAACEVKHPGLVQVFDYGTLAEGAPYIMMEFIEGETLRKRLERGRISPTEIFEIVSQLASALTVVHEQHIVHRDVKPENVMLIGSGTRHVTGLVVKLLDFGIARVPWDETVTQEGAIFGTLAYMAPEQCVPGESVTTAADVYGLGVVLFELLRGAPLFSGTPAAIARAHLVDAPPLDAIAEASMDVARLVGKMLNKAPSARPTAAFVLDELRRWPASMSPSTRTFAPTEPSRSEPPVGLVTRPSAQLRSRPRLAATATTIAIAISATLTLAIAFGAFRALRAKRAAHPQIELSSMVRLGGGSFAMGRDAKEVAADCASLGPECIRATLERELPRHAVFVSPFYLDVNEATNRDFVNWLEILRPSLEIRMDGDTKVPRSLVYEPGDVLFYDAAPPAGGIEIHDDGSVSVRLGFEELPVVQITWDAARRYCASRGKRLPTEAEYELASRGLNDRRYPWGSDEPRCEGVIFGRMDRGPCEGRPQGVRPVSEGDQDWSPEGIHGLAGNASEWMEDAFLQPFYADCGECVDPVATGATGPASAQAVDPELRVFRGSGWSNSKMFVRSTGRARWDRRSLTASLGVRCALSGKE